MLFIVFKRKTSVVQRVGNTHADAPRVRTFFLGRGQSREIYDAHDRQTPHGRCRWLHMLNDDVRTDRTQRNTRSTRASGFQGDGSHFPEFEPVDRVVRRS